MSNRLFTRPAAAGRFSCGDPLATLKDIAARAAVDPSTVSRVFNNSPGARVSPETHRRILEIAREVGYRGNLQARALRTGKTGMIGLVFPETDDPILAQYHRLLEQRLRVHGHEPLVIRTGWFPEAGADEKPRHFDLLHQGVVDGMICLHARSSEMGAYEELRGRGLPLALRAIDEAGFDRYPGAVCLGAPEGFYRLARHLAERGCRHVGVVGGTLAREVAAGREGRPEAGQFARALGENGLRPDAELAFPIRFDADDHLVTSDALATWLRETPRIDGIIASSHRELLALWRAIRVAGRRVPDDLMLATLGDSDLTRLWEPSITVWNPPITRVCNALVHALVRQLERPGQIPDAVVFRADLIERESTRRPEVGVSL